MSVHLTCLYPRAGAENAHQVVVGDVVSYQAMELGANKQPSHSSWRFGTVTALEKGQVRMAPWPPGARHPLFAAWEQHKQAVLARMKQVR